MDFGQNFDDPTIKALVETMITMQRNEIQELQDFLDGHTPQASDEGEIHSK